jgi:signal transduction histidine kinase
MPWVQVSAYQDEQKICVAFENWGVPISRDEVEQRLIFQLGYRGKWSTDRGRLGTGIGLTDADRVARAHGGAVIVESKPASPTLYPQNEEVYYKQPFKTQVTLCLPVLGSHPRGEA